MGYALCTSNCFNCGRIFAYNPMRVPSIIRDPKVGREPVCLACITAANPARERKGLPPIVPHPDAYEPCNEEELS